ncbi:hypothetical protein IFT84_19085 [Rhizobium sp. CFBP 8762]|uniref:alpha/beta hydrolase n=1 Tax=Rhizobium sp. CFBP 8762 TaxID=2775279 RepID=UPI001786E7B0|nr:hypothetical protein [Rhizobium sp. CFBP 8762]MBD8556619.1 hypothetical protein [Rhizobium sp. CFBP 8762]
MSATDADFIHSFHASTHGSTYDSSTTFVLLHGTGGDETSLLPLMRHIAPGSATLAMRGRSLDEGFARWFRRQTAVTFDQAHIRAEAEALDRFLKAAMKRYDIEPETCVFLGFSNGANMIGAMLESCPDTIRNAILLRPMQVLNAVDPVNLTGVQVLVTNGAQDPFGPYAPPLIEHLERAGASVASHMLPVGHDLILEDARLCRSWLDERGL